MPERRKTDLAAHDRLDALERRINSIGAELESNTDFTKSMHAMIVGTEDRPGIQSKVAEMHDAFAAAKGGLKALETMARMAKPIALVGGLLLAIGAWMKTGTFTLPDFK